tara:strand:- start:1904 stop:2068 length:165 start_codon:yes stop_codon:yes gene_type:complete
MFPTSKVLSTVDFQADFGSYENTSTSFKEINFIPYRSMLGNVFHYKCRMEDQSI